MRQFTQKLQNGDMKIKEVVSPVLAPGIVLVRNHYSVISAGTESSTVKTARKNLVGKAMERPQQVKQVVDVLRQMGPLQTYRTVMKRLDSYSSLGYSSSGEVIGIGRGVSGLSIGDKVACAGVGYACHAEIIAVPANLCVKLGEGADLKKAAFNTLGAIALQGIRQADLRLGESCAVIGLGLIGQLTCLMLRASGVRVVGIDINANAVNMAGEHCVDLSLNRFAPGIVDEIFAFTHGLGLDAVIITAESSSLDPINFSGEIARKKGRIIIVGAVPTGFNRDPHYYRKELELKMSCSYGPGRYDPDYEEKGIDYPPEYVRWTENRNMQAFQELIQSGRIDVDYLTTHEFPLEDAPKAYDLIVEKKEPFLGIMLKYDTKKPLSRERIQVGSAPKGTGEVNLSFVGAGSYAQSNLLPHIHKEQAISRKGVMTSSGTTSRRVAERFGFEFCTSEEKDIFQNSEINTVFVATRHDSHFGYVLKSLKSGKNVFVEKPLCLNIDELLEIENTCLALSTQHSTLPLLMVGFNRRFSPLSSFLKSKLGKGPMAMLYRINAGAIPADSWIQDAEIGGGRIVGEVCHFVDFMTFMCGALPVRVYSSAMTDPLHLNDVVNINLEFEDGSIGTISYLANGSKSVPKEYVEIYRAGVTGILRDFKEAEIHSKGKPERKKLLSQDKGQKLMVGEFIRAVREGGNVPIGLEEIVTVTRTSFKAVESLRLRQAVEV